MIRRLLVAYAAATLALLAATQHASAVTPSPTASAGAASAAASAVPTPIPVPASEPWWVRAGFTGQRVTVVTAAHGAVSVLVAGRAQASADSGRSWRDVLADPAVGASQPGRQWRVVDGRVAQVATAPTGSGPPSGVPRLDPGSPSLAPLGLWDRHGPIAAPARLPGVVVAVDRDGVVWRRGADGGWARALLLLPQDIAAGPPRITAVAAFERVPLSDAIYLATDGYAVLESTNGGDDWVRAGPGLPAHVLSLAADDSAQAVYAATADGLWVHHLRAAPAPPSYPDAALHWRWLGVALVTLAAAAVSLGGMARVLR